jgi:3-deoxy-D-manno-octulosonate 8-phosphate phosphatase (KDO 8-P phosphatase)
VEDNRAHGRDERVRVQDFHEGAEFFYRLVRRLSSAPCILFVAELSFHGICYTLVFHFRVLEDRLARPAQRIRPGIARRAKEIKILLMDVDGTMTDGSVTLLSQPDGTALEIKTFDAHDGQGLTLAHTAGIRTGCITGRESPALVRRANEMKMEFIYQKQPTKIPALEEILKKSGVPESAVAYVGDDLPDLPVMRRVGLAVAVGDAVLEVKLAAHYVTKAVAGRGAIREAVELILKSKGIWDEMIEKARA